jgi:hypothetical protein
LIQKKQDVIKREGSSRRNRLKKVEPVSFLCQEKVMPRFVIFLTGKTQIRFREGLSGSTGTYQR